ncbi:MAG: hypothetical protein QXZ09_05730 [Candidatus Methanomethylicaceae archaeon]
MKPKRRRSGQEVEQVSVRVLVRDVIQEATRRSEEVGLSLSDAVESVLHEIAWSRGLAWTNEDIARLKFFVLAWAAVTLET